MSHLSSNLNTWLKRNGFVGEGNPRQAMRESNGYIERSGRKFRVREASGLVDIGELYETFDRWANSTERTISIADFKKEFTK